TPRSHPQEREKAAADLLKLHAAFAGVVFFTLSSQLVRHLFCASAEMESAEAKEQPSQALVVLRASTDAIVTGQQGAKIPLVEWFGQKRFCAELVSLIHQVQILKGRQHEGWDGGALVRFHPTQHFHAVHARHPQVQQEKNWRGIAAVVGVGTFPLKVKDGFIAIAYDVQGV